MSIGGATRTFFSALLLPASLIALSAEAAPPELQTHSCKPQGGDVQFAYDKETRQIASVEFPSKCATLHEPAAAGVSFDLLDCSSTSAEQLFIYNAEASEFMPERDPGLCVAAGAASQAAGPFMSRILELAPCASTDARLKQWVIKGEL